MQKDRCIRTECFSNISEAFSFLKSLEQKAYQNDEMRKRAPLVMESTLFNTPILPKPLTVHDLDYPFSAFYNTASADKFIPSHLMSGRFTLKPNLRFRKFLFRGQSVFYPFCVPSIYRTNKEEKRNFLIEECALGQELMLLMLSHPLVQLLDLGFKFADRHFRLEMNLFGLAQHYYNKTSLLDFTSDPLVAAFFAVTDCKDDIYTPVLDEDREGVLYIYDLNPETSFKLDKLRTIGLQVFPRSSAQKGFLLEMNKGENLNDNPNVHYVKFKHNAEFSKQIFDMMEGGKRLFPDDILARHWNTYNKDKKYISKSAMVLNSKMNPTQSYDSLLSAIREYDYSIKDYKPVFTQEELAEYYQDVKNGFWEEFCNKIHIPGDNDGKRREELLQIENNDDYKWAFMPVANHQIDHKAGFLLKIYEKALLV